MWPAELHNLSTDVDAAGHAQYKRYKIDVTTGPRIKSSIDGVDLDVC